MELYHLSITRSELSGCCKRCGQTFSKLYSVTLSSGEKSNTLLLCEECAKAAKSSVDKKNSEISAGQSQPTELRAENVTFEEARKLRELTGAGIADCKKALAKANGNMEAAAALLRQGSHAARSGPPVPPPAPVSKQPAKPAAPPKPAAPAPVNSGNSDNSQNSGCSLHL